MIINNNMQAINAHRQLGINATAQSKSIEKLSSGLRINRAGDDAAGLSISEKMRAQIRGLNQASRNAQDGISLIQTAEGALNEVHEILQRMRKLAVQAANDTNVATDRSYINNEIEQLQAEINRIASTTEFNTQKLLNGDKATKALNFQIGANYNQKVSLTISTMTTTGLSVANIKVDSFDNASKAISTINDAINKVSKERSKLGAIQNRLEHTIKNLDTAAENLQASESRIRDVDMAKEIMQFSKLNILNQAAQTMLAQANQNPQIVLQLLR